MVNRPSFLHAHCAACGRWRASAICGPQGHDRCAEGAPRDIAHAWVYAISAPYIRRASQWRHITRSFMRPVRLEARSDGSQVFDSKRVRSTGDESGSRDPCSTALRLVAFSSDAGHASFRGRCFVGATTSAAWIVSGARFRMSFLIRTGRTAMRAILHQASATFSLPEHMVPSIHMECRVINDRAYDSASAECHGREAE
jgi:hypothetical protein